MTVQKHIALRASLTGAMLLGLVSCTSVPSNSPVSADAALQRANAAMGGAALKSISFAGSGTGATFGQAFAAGQAWPKITYSSFSRVADYENTAFREDAARSRAEPNGGGAVPLIGTGEQRTTGLMRGASAWNMVGPAPVAAPVAYDTRLHDLWTTPHGVIKAAMANSATAQMRTVDGQAVTAVSFAVPYSAGISISRVDAADLTTCLDLVS